MKVRSQQISEKLDHEAQCGFRIERGTIDGVWNIRMLVDKRREWGAETWLLLIDLVKAFDRVPRSLLWKFMQRFGYPPKFIRVLKKLHTGVKVHFEVNGVKKVINSTIGGKQGDLLFPDLFNLHICAIMQIWRQVGKTVPCYPPPCKSAPTTRSHQVSPSNHPAFSVPFPTLFLESGPRLHRGRTHF